MGCSMSNVERKAERKAERDAYINNIKKSLRVDINKCEVCSKHIEEIYYDITCYHTFHLNCAYLSRVCPICKFTPLMLRKIG